MREKKAVAMRISPAYVSCRVTKLMPKRYTLWGRSPRGSGSARLATTTMISTMKPSENNALKNAIAANALPEAFRT